MIEKIKTFDFLNATDGDILELIKELVSLPKEELKNCVNEIVDTLDSGFASEENDDDLPVSYQKIFSESIILSVLEDLATEYGITN